MARQVAMITASFWLIPRLIISSVRVAPLFKRLIHFVESNGNLLLGLCETWIDTLGVSNTRCSEVNPVIGNQGYTHAEAPETVLTR